MFRRSLLAITFTLAPSFAAAGGDAEEAVSAEEPPASGASGDLAPELVVPDEHRDVNASIERALAGKVDLHVARTPLRDALEMVAGRYSVPVFLDRKALEGEGIDIKQKVTVHVDHVSLESALYLLLDPLDLTFFVRREVLFVTTNTAAEEMLEMRTYPVTDLITPPADESLSVQHSKLDFDSLIEVITTSVEPTSWDQVGGPGSIAEYELGGALTISQTRAIHRQIEALFKSLREMRARLVKREAVAGIAAAKLSLKVFQIRTPEIRLLPEAAAGSPDPSSKSAEKAERAESAAKVIKEVPTAAELVELIVTAIEPESWQVNGGPAEIYSIPGAIVVRHTDDVARKVYNLLGAAGALAPRSSGGSSGGGFGGGGFGGAGCGGGEGDFDFGAGFDGGTDP